MTPLEEAAVAFLRAVGNRRPDLELLRAWQHLRDTYDKTDTTPAVPTLPQNAYRRDEMPRTPAPWVRAGTTREEWTAEHRDVTP